MLSSQLHINRFVTALYQADEQVTWEFNEGLEGWGQATSNEMQLAVYHMGDEMWIDIEGPDAHIDSPNMNVTIGLRQTVALRYRYIGSSIFGKLRVTTSKLEHGRDENHGGGFFDTYFPIIGDGRWHIGYAHIYLNEEKVSVALNNTITQLRLWPGCHRVSDKSWEQSDAPHSGNAFQIDWFRLVRAPVLNRVTGCNGEKFARDEDFNEIHYDVDAVKLKVNGVLEHHQTIWKRRLLNYSYASTYNCLRKGGEAITIEGNNFGEGGINGSGAPAHVFIDQMPCTFVKHDPHLPQQRLTCITPSLRVESSDYQYHTSIVEVKNGKLPGLIGTSNLLAYAYNPPRPTNLTLTNFASRSIDLSWQPGGKVWQQMTYTGYILRWRANSSISWTHSMVTGNITTTTIRGLSPNSTYVFGLAGLNEDQNNAKWWNDLDLYGKRSLLHGALEGSTVEIQGRTLMYDVNFQRFNANMTQNHGPEIDRESIGPTGMYSGEGHYGLVLVGSASIANCNASSFCCDAYDDEAGYCTDESTLTCLSTRPSSHPFDNITLPGFGKIVANLSAYSYADRDLFNTPCGPALRLTPSEARMRGAAWYPRQLEVGEGFDTTFTFEISNPSFRCNNMDGVFKNCRSRGGDGFAFVIQADHLGAIGSPGLGMGYDGINNSIAIEFDTYFNYESLDPYENHVSVHTRGFRYPNSANHTYSLGHTNAVPDLTDGKLRVRIKYESIIDEKQLLKPNFVASPHVLYFLENNDFHNGGVPDWGAGLGMLHIYCENMDVPVLSVPLHLSATLNLNQGRAWVGFTAATGVETFQDHNVYLWQFSSLRKDTT